MKRGGNIECTTPAQAGHAASSVDRAASLAGGPGVRIPGSVRQSPPGKVGNASQHRPARYRKGEATAVAAARGLTVRLRPLGAVLTNGRGPISPGHLGHPGGHPCEIQHGARWRVRFPAWSTHRARCRYPPGEVGSPTYGCPGRRDGVTLNIGGVAHLSAGTSVAQRAERGWLASHWNPGRRFESSSMNDVARRLRGVPYGLPDIGRVPRHRDPRKRQGVHHGVASMDGYAPGFYPGEQGSSPWRRTYSI